jgi:hypothetical protein
LILLILTLCDDFRREIFRLIPSFVARFLLLPSRLLAAALLLFPFRQTFSRLLSHPA